MHTAILILLAVFLNSTSIASDTASPNHHSAIGAIMTTPTIQGHVSVRSWKSFRDNKVVKQALDYSCGAASLATLLRFYYDQNITEPDILNAMDKDEGRASFADMAEAVRKFGFKADGFAASWEQLKNLRVPVLLYLRNRRDDHFVILRGISEHTVWVADPSLGNRTYSREQFLELWETRKNQPNPELAGKFLAVLPLDASTKIKNNFFTEEPRRQSANAVQQLQFHSAPP